MPRIEECRPLDVVVAAVMAISLVMFVQLLLGVFRPMSAVFLGVGAVGIGTLVFVRRLAWPDRRAILIALALGGLALLPRLNPFLYVWGGQDQGIYVAMSSYFGRTHGLPIKDEVRESLSDGDKAEYDKFNQWEQFGEARMRRGYFEGTHQPGIYIKSLEDSEYVFQFYPLQPLWMALFADLLGDAHRVQAVTFFSLLNILMLSLLAYELAGGMIGAGILLACLLVVSPIHAFLSRFPVTENVTVFFSATAFYYLVRYFKARSAGELRPSALALSGGAWFCLFCNHISGFMYFPVLASAAFAGAATARSRREMLHMLFYGMGVIFAYAISLWYGLTWSFPYSFDIYRAIFGKDLGALFVAHWKDCIGLALMASAGGCVMAWTFGDQIGILWRRHALVRWLNGMLAATALLLLVHGLLDGYRLGYTGHYADDELLGAVYQLSRGGANAFLHSSVAVLGIYLSPFLILLLMAVWSYQWRSSDLYGLGLLLTIVVFLAARTGVESFTYYYYYGRYLGGELVPYMLLAAALALHHLMTQGRRTPRFLGAGIFQLGLIWSAAALAMQYPGGEMHRLDASLRPLLRTLKPDDLLILALDRSRFFPLQTALDYYYGHYTVFVEPASVPRAIENYSAVARWSGVYVLSSMPRLPNLPLVAASSLEFDHYGRGRYDFLPKDAWSGGEALFLHKAR